MDDIKFLRQTGPDSYEVRVPSSPEQLEKLRELFRADGMSEEEIRRWMDEHVVYKAVL